MLQLFYGNPNRSFYVREITRKIDEQINSVRRELANLLSIGIISSDTTNNRLYYEVDQKYQYYGPLSAIFGESKVVSEDLPTSTQKDDVKAIRALGHVDLAVFTGKFTRDETAGIDFLVVGDINQSQLAKYIADLEEKEGKEILYTCLSSREFQYRLQINDRFISKVMEAKKQILIDKDNIFS